jgi:hypothetical protein
VARADHRSNASNRAWGSFFLWPKATGPYAPLIRRRRCRLIIFLVAAAIVIAIAAAFASDPENSSSNCIDSLATCVSS